MADRPSVKEILAKVRAAGPVAQESATDQETPEEPAPDEGDAEAAAPAAVPVAVAQTGPTPESLGRPLSMKEKLAAARNRPAGAEAAPAPEASAPVAEPAPAAASLVTATAGSGTVPAPAASHLTPETLGRPLTLKEKLAAARGSGAGAAPSGVASAPAASKTAAGPAAKAPAASSRQVPPLAQSTDPRDLAEHLRRTGAEKERAAKAAAAAKAAPAAKQAAPKKVESKVVPPRPGKEAAASMAIATLPTTRRGLFAIGFWIAAGWATFMASMVALSAMTLRFMFPNVLAEPPSTIKVGFPGDFEKDQVNERWKAEWGFWLVRSTAYNGEDELYALSTICTHLGCPPNWLASEQKFKCPCHGSGFYISGVNFEGPAPRPLERYKVAVGDDGQIVVDKSQKFQEELGQWKDPESFIKV